MKQWLAYLVFYRRIIILLLVPALLLPLIQNNDEVSRCAYIILVMAAYWVTQVIPIAATALLPLVMLPLMGLQPSGVVAGNYIKDSTFLILAGTFVAAAIEEWKLHKRIALRLLLLCGPKPRWLLLGCMLPSWVLSMLIPNTATVIIMMPIIDEVLQLVKPKYKENIEELYPRSDEMDTPEEVCMLSLQTPSKEEYSSEQTRWRSLCSSLSLGAVYASSIGGSAVLTGTPTNIVLKAYLDEIFMKRSGKESQLTYGTWVAMAMPYSAVLLLAAWGLLLLVFLRNFDNNTEREKSIKAGLRQKYVQLDTITFAEVEITILLLMLSLILFLRRPGLFDGWSVWFPSRYVSGTTAALIMGLLTFILPSSLSNFRNVKSGTQYQTLMTWKTVQQRVPWGVIILIGGGFAIAEASQETGLSKLIGERLFVLASLRSWVVLFISTLLISMVTELTTNIAVATLAVPILSELALQFGVHPLYFALPCTLTSNIAFMLPVGTPPNAIGYSYNYFSMWDMLKAGVWLNIIGVLLVNVTINTLGQVIFTLSETSLTGGPANDTSYTTVGIP